MKNDGPIRKIKRKSKKPLLGFIGQGFVGSSYSADFKRRGYEIVRYANEEPYIKNKEKMKDCDIVFMAVPTPTTAGKFDDSIIREVVKLVGKGKIAVIKSTILPGTTRSIQKHNKNIYVFHSPEFLTEVTAKYDAAHPDRNIVGIPKDTPLFRKKAKTVLDVLPKAPYNEIMSSDNAEFVKYAGNTWFYMKVVYVNLLYDFSMKLKLDWSIIEKALGADSRVGATHLSPVHKSGRGAGGNCFIKDFAAFAQMYREIEKANKYGVKLIDAIEIKNLHLLKMSGKDQGKVKAIYGKTSRNNSKNR